MGQSPAIQNQWFQSHAVGDNGQGRGASETCRQSQHIFLISVSENSTPVEDRFRNVFGCKEAHVFLGDFRK